MPAKRGRNILTKFSETYNTNKIATRKVLDELQKNNALIWTDGKPRSPASDKLVKCIEWVSEIDAKMKNIDAVLQQIDKGREAGRPLEELLQMASNSTSKVRVKRREAGGKDDESVSVESRLVVNPQPQPVGIHGAIGPALDGNGCPSQTGIGIQAKGVAIVPEPAGDAVAHATNLVHRLGVGVSVALRTGQDDTQPLCGARRLAMYPTQTHSIKEPFSQLQARTS